MHFAKFLALVGVFATAAIAAPNKPTKPPQPPPPTPPPPPTQQNACSNGATPYCCNTDSKGAYGSCYTYQSSSQCGMTSICCNAQNSQQNCIGSAQLTIPPYYPYYY